MWQISQTRALGILVHAAKSRKQFARWGGCVNGMTVHTQRPLLVTIQLAAINDQKKESLKGWNYIIASSKIPTLPWCVRNALLKYAAYGWHKLRINCRF
jgi:hypothetical protein